jgi:hypothetical protein
VAGAGLVVAVATGFGEGFAGATVGGFGAAGLAGAVVLVETTDLAQTVTELGPVLAEYENPELDEVLQAHTGMGEN